MATYRSGTLTFDPTFISAFVSSDPSIIGAPVPQSTIITGDDDVDYYIAGGRAGVGGAGGTLSVYDASDSTLAFSKGASTIRSEANAASITPPNERGDVNGGAVTVPETNYFAVIGGGAFGVTTDKRVIYYEINDSGSAVIVGGYAGSTGDLTEGGPDTAFGAAFSSFGWYSPQSTDPISTGSPLCFAFRNTIVVVPSIDEMIAETPIIENKTDHWEVKLMDISSSGFGSNIFTGLDDGPLLADFSRGFYIPFGSDQLFCTMFYGGDLEAHAAGTESTTNSYLDTYASTYEDGLISSVEIDFAAAATTASAFNFTTSFGSLEVAFHERFFNEDGSRAFPFPDDRLKFDGSAGTANTEYYSNPTVYPSDPNDYTAPWFLFFPRHYRGTGEAGYFGIRIFEWDPVTGIATFLDFGAGQVWNPGVDVNSALFSGIANIKWDRSTGALTAHITAVALGIRGHVIIDLGTFNAILNCAPVVDASFPTALTLFLNEEYSRDFSYFFESPEGVAMTYSATGLPPGISMATNGVLSGAIVSPATEGAVYTSTLLGVNSCGTTSGTLTFTVGTTVTAGGESFNFLHSGS